MKEIVYLNPAALRDVFTEARSIASQLYREGKEPAQTIAEIAGASVELLDQMEEERLKLKSRVEYLDAQIEKIKPIADYFRKAKDYESKN